MQNRAVFSESLPKPLFETLIHTYIIVEIASIEVYETRTTDPVPNFRKTNPTNILLYLICTIICAHVYIYIYNCCIVEPPGRIL